MADLMASGRWDYDDNEMRFTFARAGETVAEDQEVTLWARFVWTLEDVLDAYGVDADLLIAILQVQAETRAARERLEATPPVP